jgi:uncharacterized membrane protein
MGQEHVLRMTIRFIVYFHTDFRIYEVILFIYFFNESKQLESML